MRSTCCPGSRLDRMVGSDLLRPPLLCSCKIRLAKTTNLACIGRHLLTAHSACPGLHRVRNFGELLSFARGRSLTTTTSELDAMAFVLATGTPIVTRWMHHSALTDPFCRHRWTASVMRSQACNVSASPSATCQRQSCKGSSPSQVPVPRRTEWV